MDGGLLETDEGGLELYRSDVGEAQYRQWPIRIRKLKWIDRSRRGCSISLREPTCRMPGLAPGKRSVTWGPCGQQDVLSLFPFLCWIYRGKTATQGRMEMMGIGYSFWNDWPHEGTSM